LRDLNSETSKKANPMQYSVAIYLANINPTNHNPYHKYYIVHFWCVP